MPKYRPGSPELREEVQQALRDHHTDLDEAGVRVDVTEAYPDLDKNGDPTGPAIKDRGYPCVAQIRVLGGKMRGLGHGDAEISIDAYNWPTFSPEQRQAYIDHELTHLELVVDSEDCVKRDKYDRPTIRLRLHDRQFGWFDAVVERHGVNSGERQQAEEFMKSEAFPHYLPGFGQEVVADKAIAGSIGKRKTA